MKKRKKAPKPRKKWGNVKPFMRVFKSKKAYDRKKNKKTGEFEDDFETD